MFAKDEELEYIKDLEGLVKALRDEIAELKAENAEMSREVERLEEMCKDYFCKLDEIRDDISYFLKGVIDV